jgi:hypothetical protein
MTVDFGLYSPTLTERQRSGEICLCCGVEAFADMRFPNATPPGRPRACRACRDEQNAELTLFECSTEE